MFITVIPDTGVNNLYVNSYTGRSVLVSGVGNQAPNIILTGNFNNLGGASLHNSLPDLQGGSSNQYYHLTSAQYSDLSTGQFIREGDARLSDPRLILPDIYEDPTIIIDGGLL